MKRSFRQPVARRAAGYHFSRSGNLLLVQGSGEGSVSIHATADNLDPGQQEAFIQYLGAEGFLSGDFQPSGCFHESVLYREEPSVRWIVDPSWPQADAVFALHVRRLGWWTAGTLIVWLALMAVLVCC